MAQAASVSGEVDFIHRLKSDPQRWSSTVKSVDQLTSDPHTAFVVRRPGHRLEREVGVRFVKMMDPWRQALSSQQVQRLMSDRAGLHAAMSGTDLTWILKARDQVRIEQQSVLSHNLERLAAAPRDGTLPSACRKIRSWPTNPDFSFARLERRHWRRLAAFCDDVSSRLIQVSETKPASTQLEELEKVYTRLMGDGGEVGDAQAYQLFISARLATVDPHSAYVAPANKSDFAARLSGSYVGLGVNMKFDAGKVTFDQVNPAGPGFDAGIVPGDRLLSIGQDPGLLVPVEKLDPVKVLSIMSGVEGGQVWMRIQSADGLEATKVVRRRRIEIHDNRIASKRLVDAQHPSVLHIRISNFYRDPIHPQRPGGSTTNDIRQALTQAQPGDWVLLDLRDNGGGLLGEAIGVAGLFMAPGPVVQVEKTSGEVSALASEDPPVWSGPLAVLVNRHTASASEIVSGALQDRGRAVIMGETTYGKGTAQNLFDLDRWAGAPAPVYGQVNLTAMRFFRPSGESTQLIGVVPDVAFLPEIGPGRERSLDHALKPKSLTAALASTHAFTPQCLAAASKAASKAWSSGAWSDDWFSSLDQPDKRPIALAARRAQVEKSRDTGKRMRDTIAALPLSDAPLSVALDAISVLQSCPAP
jgi:C-terminal peptidase prc